MKRSCKLLKILCVTNQIFLGIFLHILADTLGSVGVIISSALIWLYDWKIVDPICSLCIAILIFMSVVPLLKSSAKTLLQRTPEHFEEILKQCLEEVCICMWNFVCVCVVRSFVFHFLLSCVAFYNKNLSCLFVCLCGNTDTKNSWSYSVQWSAFLGTHTSATCRHNTHSHRSEHKRSGRIETSIIII